MTSSAGMPRALRLFLDGLIDYAGMFPPADLPLQDALDNFLDYGSGPDAWMLGGFILPAADAGAAAGLLADRRPDRTIRIYALGRGGADWTVFFDGLEAELAAIGRLRKRLGGRVEISVFETPLPAAELDFQIRADALVDRAAEQLNSAGLLPYFEVPAGPEWQARAERAIQAIGRLGKGRAARFKIRTGGVIPAAFPGTDSLAWTIATAVRRGAAFKCTAGLHHPIRQHRDEVGTKMHGFVNVFTAAVLAHAHRLDAGQIEAILAEEEPGAFEFTEDALAWRGRSAGLEQIRAARQKTAVSFGSCSFDEPREDLGALGWM